MKDVGVALFVVASSLLVGACSEKKGGSAESETTKPSNATQPHRPATATKPVDDQTAPKQTGEEAVASAKLKEECETNCLLLTEHSIDDLVGDGYCELCGSTVAEACTAPNPFAKDNCDQFDYQRNCVFAAAGYKFKKKKWQTQFGKLPWYKGRDNFKHSDLSAVAQTNVKALRDRTSVCRGQGDGPVSAKDMEMVKRFFKNKRSKKLSLPKILYVDNQPATSEEFLTFLMTDGLFELKSHTPIRYQDWGPSGEIDKSKYRSVHVPTGAPSPKCKEKGDGDCEGFEWLDMVLDKNGKVVELGVSAAACPFVYIETRPGSFTFVGEILRNLNRRSLETTQELSLSPSPQRQIRIDNDAKTIRVRIAEEKPERSYLDFVSLLVGDQEVFARQCSDSDNGGALPNFCEDDGRYTIIEPGQTIDLVFETTGLNFETDAVSLRANGFYKPLQKHRPN